MEELREKLQPGDILIERRNWFLSNAFLPGFWPHAALYLGDQEALEELGVTEDARVVPHWDEFLGQDALGHPYAVLEAISEGVVFTTLEHSVGEADAVRYFDCASQKHNVARRLPGHFLTMTSPMTFEFDFFSTDRLFCSEVVYRAYDGMLELPLKNIMGRLTLPVDTFVEVYASSGSQDRPFDLIQFLDMDEKGGQAFLSSESEFINTLQRSRFTFLK